MSLLRATELNVSYGARRVVCDVDFSLAPGELLAVVGPNGSGKTTLARALTGVTPATHRGLELGGTALERLARREIARRVAVVPQDTHVPFDFTVEEMVAMGRAPHLDAFGREGEADRELVKRALTSQGIADLAVRLYPTLSGGEKQRVLLARAATQAAPALILDEPTSQMDLGHRLRTLAWLGAWIDEARDARGIAWITHDLNQAARFANRIHLLHEGATLAVGPPADVLTADHIRAAYRVEAEVYTSPHGHLEVHALAPSP